MKWPAHSDGTEYGLIGKITLLGQPPSYWIRIQGVLDHYDIKDAAELEKILARKAPPKLTKAEARVLRKLLQRERA